MQHGLYISQTTTTLRIANLTGTLASLNTGSDAIYSRTVATDCALVPQRPRRMAEAVTDKYIVRKRSFLMHALPHISFGKDVLTIRCKIDDSTGLCGTEKVAGCMNAF
jgi:hypothetical protein